ADTLHRGSGPNLAPLQLNCDPLGAQLTLAVDVGQAATEEYVPLYAVNHLALWARGKPPAPVALKRRSIHGQDGISRGGQAKPTPPRIRRAGVREPLNSYTCLAAGGDAVAHAAIADRQSLDTVG